MVHCTNCGKEMSEQAISCPNCGHPNAALAGGISATMMGTGQYAGWGQRVVASIIDGVVISVPSYIIMAIFSVGYARSAKITIDPNTGRITSVGTGFFAAFFGSLFIVLLAGVLYKVLMEGGPKGQTLGKMAMKIKVVDEKSRGQLGYGKAAIRWVVAWVLWLLIYIPGIIDVLFPLWDPKKQTLHDKAAGTVVIPAV